MLSQKLFERLQIGPGRGAGQGEHAHLVLALARLLMGVGTALSTTLATAYMGELQGDGDTARAANWVTASTSLGFGLGGR